MLVVTGATGFIGSQLVPLIAKNEDVLAVSRQSSEVLDQRAGVTFCDYGELAHRDLRGATILHLAVRNNDRQGSREEFRAANVDFLTDIAATAKARGARRFINLCSTHALDANPEDHYGSSKQAGARALREFWPHGSINLYIPAVYGKRLQGRLALLQRLPKGARSTALAVLRLVKPVISIDRLYVAVSRARAQPIESESPWAGEIFCADPVPDRGLFTMAKRTIDLFAALILVVLGGWAMIVIALYVRLDSKGPAIFAQQRVGRFGRVFTCYKFRTMTVGTANAATHSVSAAAVTRAGRMLRKTKLDELPQLLNVLCNDMSLVGPRPCLPLQSELIEQRRARGVLALKPGITGMAQVSHIDMSDPARLAVWDAQYGAFRTLIGDMIIIFKTVLGRGKGDRVSLHEQPVEADQERCNLAGKLSIDGTNPHNV